MHVRKIATIILINWNQVTSLVPIFLDVHKVPFSEDNLKELCRSPKDEFGVEHINLFYNKESRVCFCLLQAPNKEMVEEHHAKVDIKCEWIMEVSMAAPAKPANSPT